MSNTLVIHTENDKKKISVHTEQQHVLHSALGCVSSLSLFFFFASVLKRKYSSFAQCKQGQRKSAPVILSQTLTQHRLTLSIEKGPAHMSQCWQHCC